MSKTIKNLQNLSIDKKKVPLPPNLVKNKEKIKNIDYKFSILIGISIVLFATTSFILFSAILKKTKNNPNKFYAKSLKMEKKEYIIPIENEFNRKLEKPKNFDKMVNEIEKKQILKIKNKQSKKVLKQKIKKTYKKHKSQDIKSNQSIILTEGERQKVFSEYVVKGDEASLLGNQKEAIKYYEKALLLKSDLNVLNNLLLLYIRAGKPNLVVKVFDTKNPPIKNENLISGLLIEMINKNYLKQAKLIAQKTVKYDKKGYIYYAKGFLYEKLKKPLLAYKFYKKSYEKNKNDPYIIFQFARFLEKQGDYKNAKSLYKEILSISTDMALNRKVEKRLYFLSKLD